EGIRALGQAARQLLAEAGRPAGSIVDRVSATLTAAVADAEGRRDIERGRLTSELTPPGFEVYDDMDVPQQRRPREQKAAPERDDRTRRKELELKRRELRAELRELEREARIAERAADRAEADARRARAAADEARDRAESARGRLDELGGLSPRTRRP